VSDLRGESVKSTAEIVAAEQAYLDSAVAGMTPDQRAFWREIEAAIKRFYGRTPNP